MNKVSATRTFINKYYDKFAAECPKESTRSIPMTIAGGNRLVATPMGSNTR